MSRTNLEKNLPPRNSAAETPALLSEAHRRYLADRAVDDAVAAERGYRSITRKAELGRLGFSEQQRRVGLLLLIHGVTGEIIGYQLRADEPRINRDGDPIKFETPGGSRMMLDVHPRLSAKRLQPDGVELPPLIADPSAPLFTTEGIPKADALVSIGLCAVATLGVWGYRGTNEVGGKVALAAWESVALNARTIYVIFDSDIMTKRGPYAALSRIAPFLESRGAIVRFIYLPPGPNGGKVGVDDYIAGLKRALTVRRIKVAG